MVNNNISLIFQSGVVNNNNTTNSIRPVLIVFNGYTIVFGIGCIMVNNNIFLTGSIHTVGGFIGKLIISLINIFLLDLLVYCFS